LKDEDIGKIKCVIEDAEAILVFAGAGMSADSISQLIEIKKVFGMTIHPIER
jgi:L-2-hydroxyglutarate oxidase LhgO